MIFKNYLWDFDGTLVDSYPHTTAAFEKTLAEAGIPFEHDEAQALLYDTLTAARDRYALTPALYDTFMEHEMNFGLRPVAVPFPYAAAVLRSICEAGGRNFLYTHRNESARSYLRLYDLEKYFSGIVDSGFHFPAKPAPDAIEYICRANRLDKAETVMVGDREIDILAGINAGTAAFLVRTHPMKETSTAAGYEADDLLSLARILEIPVDPETVFSSCDAARLRDEAAAAAAQLCESARLAAGSLVVVGCSSSEIAGGNIGHASSPEVAQAVLEGLMREFRPRGIALAAQCCEHLNRALVLERAAAGGLRTVNAVPMPKAGGSFAAAAYRTFDDPVLVEEIEADAGLDIGSTLIGMHLKRVAVPLRLAQKTIGRASVTAARVRPPFTGGGRTVYRADWM